MRILAALSVGALVGCTSSVTVPNDPVIYEVPPTGTASSAGGDSVPHFSSELRDASGTRIGADSLNLGLYSLEQQKIDATIAEQKLASAKSQLVVVPTTGLPNQVPGVNIALFAQQTNNAKGQSIYRRSGGRFTSGCGRYNTPDDAQRAFLAAGGPETDSLGLDSDGDGFACKWDPAPYRALAL